MQNYISRFARSLSFYIAAALVLVLTLNSVSALSEEDAKALFDLGYKAYSEKKFDDAAMYWGKAYSLYEAAKDEDGMAEVLNNIGLMNYYMKKFSEAEKYFLLALAIDKKRDVDKDVASDLYNIGLLYYYMHRYDEALYSFSKSAELFNELGNDEQKALIVYRVGLIHYDRGDYMAAANFFLAASEIHRKLFNRVGYAQDIVALADSLTALGRIDKALDLYDEAVKVAMVEETDESIENVIKIRITAAKALEKYGRYDAAKKYLDEAFKVAKKEKDEGLQGTVYMAMGDAHNFSGDYKEAIRNYYKALEIKKGTKELGDVARIEGKLGSLWGELLMFSEAEKAFGEERLIYQVARDSVNEAAVKNSLGNIYLKMGKMDNAFDLLKEADETFEKSGESKYRGINLLVIGEIYYEKGEYKKARNAFDTVLKLLTEKGEKRYYAKAISYLGLIDYREGKYSSSFNNFSKALTLFREERSRSREADLLIGSGLALMKMGKENVARGFFAESERIAKELNLGSLNWRAIYCQALFEEIKPGGKDEIVLSRLENALFILKQNPPELSPDILGARLVRVDDLFSKLAEKRGLSETEGKLMADRWKSASEKLNQFFGSNAPILTGKDAEYMELFVEKVGIVSYYREKLAEDEFRRADNRDKFTIELLKAQGSYLKALDRIKDKNPVLWNSYFVEVYE